MVTRKNEKRLITIACLSLIAATLLFGFLGCAAFRDMPTEKQVLLSYEGMGAVLETSKPILIAYCKDGTLNPDDCQAATQAYNEAVKAYHLLGEIALTVMDTGTDETYRTKALHLMELLNLIQTYTGES